ncbi:MAG: TlpA family protein disulfide reductase [Chlorobi bacterium]|nr:TlpA family protein disulfide reductase [Chlorobiota bacterium]
MNNTVRAVLGFWLAAVIWGCGVRTPQEPPGVTVELQGDTYRALVLQRITPKGELIAADTVAVSDRQARFTPGGQGIYFITNGSKRIPVFWENRPVRMRVEDSSFTAMEVVDGGANEAFHRYRRQYDSLAALQKTWVPLLKTQRKEAERALFDLQKQLDTLRLDFVRRHPDLAGVYVLTSLTAAPHPPVKELVEIYATYPEPVRKTDAGKYLTRRLNDISAGAPGMRIQNFTAPAPDGKLISLYSVMGKVTVVDFWASWCRPCRAQNPDLVRMYEKYHDRGLNIISVSLDRNREAWLRAIEEDGLPWYHVSHLMGWQEPVARQFHVRFIPQTFVIDKEGILRYKNLRGKLLEEKVRELLEE